MKHYRFIIIVCMMLAACGGRPSKPAVVLLTDFGSKDGAVAAMKGVIHGTDAAVPIFDITHDIPAYNVWEAAYRLQQAAPYWPSGTVFVAVVDPGVGTTRKSIVLKTTTGHYFVSPDNGSLTLVAAQMGVVAVRRIDEAAQRIPGSGTSYTFLGRDLYAFVGARLAAGQLAFEATGTELREPIISIPYRKPTAVNGKVTGTIPILDIQYGNIWTDVPDSLLTMAGVKITDSIDAAIHHGDTLKLRLRLPLVHTFGDVPPGKPLAYLNSLMQLSLAINTGNFAAVYGIGSGPEWTISISKP